MSYLNFNKEELVNLEYSLKREVLSIEPGDILRQRLYVATRGNITGYLYYRFRNSGERIMYYFPLWMKRLFNTGNLLIWGSINIPGYMNRGDINISWIWNTIRYSR